LGTGCPFPELVEKYLFSFPEEKGSNLKYQEVEDGIIFYYAAEHTWDLYIFKY
jgi:hypothetical protein